MILLVANFGVIVTLNPTSASVPDVVVIPVDVVAFNVCITCPGDENVPSALTVADAVPFGCCILCVPKILVILLLTLH